MLINRNGDLVKYNHKIDLVKFFCSIAVVLIHLTAFIHYEGMATVKNYYIYRYLFNIAVPFYFTTSGYLLAYKSDLKYFNKYIINISFIYLFFSSFYILTNIFYAVFDRIVYDVGFYNNLRSIISRINIQNIYEGNFGSFHLWYLATLILVVLFVSILKRFKMSSSAMLLLAIFFYSASLSGLINFKDVVMNGGFASGFFYVCLGQYVAKHSIRIKYSFIWFITFLLFYSLGRIVEVGNLAEIILGLSTFFLIHYCDQNLGKETFLSKMGRHSLKIYILHVFVYTFYYRILDLVGITGYNDSVIDILLTTIICIVISIILYKPLNKILLGIKNSFDNIYVKELKIKVNT